MDNGSIIPFFQMFCWRLRIPHTPIEKYCRKTSCFPQPPYLWYRNETNHLLLMALHALYKLMKFEKDSLQKW